jgi:outer membrane protein
MEVRGPTGRTPTTRECPQGGRHGWPRQTLALTLIALTVAVGSAPLAGQEQRNVVPLTLERMVDLALSGSYRMRQLNMSIDRTRLNLQSQRARLRSRVDLELSAPDFQSIAETNWNSTLQRNEIVHENSRRWEAELSIRQPVILFGYPTNGYLSLNNRVYRYAQIDEEGTRDLQYYNRYFVRYTQPLFQPNELKNDLEEAELDLEDSQLDFHGDVVETVDDLSNDYLELFEVAYDEVIHRARVANLEAAVAAAEELARVDTARAIDLSQAQVELANAREQIRQSQSQFRLNAASLKTRLNLSEADSITLDPVITVRPVPIDVERATRFALELTPGMRQLDINLRQNEIDLENTKGRGGFRVDLALSYGREMQDPVFDQIWGDPTNTYTVDVNAYVPIWDWGQRRTRIEASRIRVDQTRLRIEELEAEIRSDVRNQVRNVEEFQNRVMAMEENLSLAAGLSQTSLGRYEAGSITILDLLQSFQRETDTANNFLDAYLGWRRALLRIQELTFFDFERGVPVLERFGISVPTDGGSAAEVDPV